MKTFETIDPAQLATATGGGAFAQVLTRVRAGDLSAKQMSKLSKAMTKAQSRSDSRVPAIAEGDFGAPASSFIPITGD